MPAFSAMKVAGLPTISGLARRCGVTTTRATAADLRLAQEVAAVLLDLGDAPASAMASSQTIDCSDEHSVP